MYDHTFYKQVQISRSDIRPHIKWAVSLVILHMITSIFLRALCGYIWVNILTLSPRGDPQEDLLQYVFFTFLIQRDFQWYHYPLYMYNNCCLMRKTTNCDACIRIKRSDKSHFETSVTYTLQNNNPFLTGHFRCPAMCVSIASNFND